MKNVINVVGCGENLIQNGSLACESLIWITLFRKGLKRKYTPTDCFFGDFAHWEEPNICS